MNDFSVKAEQYEASVFLVSMIDVVKDFLRKVHVVVLGKKVVRSCLKSCANG